MKHIITLLFVTSTFFALAQKDKSFETQGELDDYSDKEFFKTEYKKQKFNRFEGSIVKLGETVYRFDDKTLLVTNTSKELHTIFEKGVFYPFLITGKTSSERKSKKEVDSMTPDQKFFYHLSRGDSLTISSIKELDIPNTPLTQKRFKFLLWRKSFANPIVYYFELTNKKANKRTTLSDFIKESELTFFKEGGVQI